MKPEFKGNTCYISIDVGESPIFELPTGYSFEQIHITSVQNIWGLYNANIQENVVLIFPPVNSKSPYILSLNILDKEKPAELRFTIEKFGQIPDPDYFNGAFNPILVTGDDGKEYNMIPSDQFK